MTKALKKAFEADTLAKPAKEALAEDRAGRTRPLDELL
jgi:hypothetical protein